MSLHKVYAPGLCKMWIFDKKITGKSKENKRIWKRPREGPRKAAAEGKNDKKRGPQAALWGCFGLPELYRKAYNTDKPVLVCKA